MAELRTSHAGATSVRLHRKDRAHSTSVAYGDGVTYQVHPRRRRTGHACNGPDTPTEVGFPRRTPK